MKPKHWILKSSLLITAGILAAIPSAHAEQEGHGGDAVVLRDASGAVVSAGLYDFYEGAERYHLTIKEDPNTPAEQQVMNVLERLAAAHSKYYLLYKPEVDRVIAIKQLTSTGARLENVDDARMVVIPEEGHGQVEQLANYTREEDLLVSRNIWERLSETDRAGLYLHEAIYHYQRVHNGATDSVLARKITANLFAQDDLRSDVKAALKAMDFPHPLPYRLDALKEVPASGFIHCEEAMIPSAALDVNLELGYIQKYGNTNGYWENIIRKEKQDDQADTEYYVFQSPEDPQKIRLVTTILDGHYLPFVFDLQKPTPADFKKAAKKRVPLEGTFSLPDSTILMVRFSGKHSWEEGMRLDAYFWIGTNPSKPKSMYVFPYQPSGQDYSGVSSCRQF